MRNQVIASVVVENAGFQTTWAAPIASLMMEQYILGKIDRHYLFDRISTSILNPDVQKDSVTYSIDWLLPSQLHPGDHGLIQYTDQYDLDHEGSMFNFDFGQASGYLDHHSLCNWRCYFTLRLQILELFYYVMP